MAGVFTIIGFILVMNEGPGAPNVINLAGLIIIGLSALLHKRRKRHENVSYSGYTRRR